MNDVEFFCSEKGLTERVDLIKKGALIAQDPTGFERVETLSESEREALRFEAAHRWRHPLALYFTIIVCSIGAAVQGWDQTGSNGANLSFPVVRHVLIVLPCSLTNISRNSASEKVKLKARQIKFVTVGSSDSSMQVHISEGKTHLQAVAVHGDFLPHVS